MVVGGLNNIDEIKKETPPEEVRMIDFYHWGKAALPKELNFEHHYLSMIKLTWVKQVETDELSYKIFQKSAGLKTPYTATPKKFLKDIVGDYGVLGMI